MAEPIRRVNSARTPRVESDALGGPYALDVLLIADDPSRPGKGRAAKKAIAAGRIESIEPLDMESVVRRLIAVLSEEQRP